jgi:hypothetical protein
MRTSLLCTEVAYGRFHEVSHISILVFVHSSCLHTLCTVSHVCWILRSTHNRLPPSLFFISHECLPSLAAPSLSVGTSHVSSAYHVAHRNAITTSHNCRTAGTRGSEARQRVPVACRSWRRHDVCMLCMLCDIRRCGSLTQPHVVHPLHVSANTLPWCAVTCLRASCFRGGV